MHLSTNDNDQPHPIAFTGFRNSEWPDSILRIAQQEIAGQFRPYVRLPCRRELNFSLIPAVVFHKDPKVRLLKVCPSMIKPTSTPDHPAVADQLIP